MIKNLLLSGILLSIAQLIIAQTTVLSGTVTTADLGDPLIGVNVIFKEKGTITDFDGKYSLELPNGTQEITFSYIGFSDHVETVTLTGGTYTLDVRMGGMEVLKEITVVADIAIDRETPVAFSNIPTKKLEEELAGQDIPMILNSTPGAYATQSGGGDGDARITIRGFNQRNVAVMLDGIPVNDMENGWVYWSNWFGLDLVTQNMQVQRGLGASKLAIPSVGGTINILTRGIRSKRNISFKQEFGNDGYLRSTIGLTTGRLNSGWGISAAGSYKQGNGWVDQTWTKGYFWYLRVDKELGNHIISASGYGAPQEHGQRSFTTPIATIDSSYAVSLGVPETVAAVQGNYGRRYNQHWGLLERYSVVDGDTIRAEVKPFNTRKNFYHKPQFSLRHSWNISEKTYLSNNVYISIGNGGGTGTFGDFDQADNGQLDVQRSYDANVIPSIFNPQMRSSSIIRASVNNHFWYGLLSTLEYNISDVLSFKGGIDLRQYKGEHYREVYDLFGGAFFVPGLEGRNARIDQSDSRLVEHDKYYYHYDGFVRWGGLFGLLEYKNEKISTFFNASAAMTGYKMVDYMWAESLELNGETHYVSYFDNNVSNSNQPGIHERVVVDNGIMYTVDNPSQASLAYANANGLTVDSTTAQNQVIDYQWIPSLTFKAGINYNINKFHNVFFNTGFLSKATRYNNYISRTFNERSTVIDDQTNMVVDTVPELGRISLVESAKNEQVAAFEAGYSFKSPKFAANLNGYFTYWNNKPLERPPTVLCPGEDPSDPEAERCPINVNGIAALHMGIEADMAYQIHKKVAVEGLFSIGDWTWQSSAESMLPGGQVYSFDAKGVHVGDAAQIQVGGLLRVEPLEGLYLKFKTTWFAKNFSNFNPESLEDSSVESWKMPNYTLFDLHAGYNFKIKDIRMGLRFNMLNLFDATYVSDATNNDTFNSPSFDDFDAKSASVFFGQGRRFNTSFNISF